MGAYPCPNPTPIAGPKASLNMAIGLIAIEWMRGTDNRKNV